MDGQVLNARHQFDNERWPLAQAAAWIIWRSRDRVVQLLSDIAERDGRVHVFDILGGAMRQENDQGRPPEGVALPFVEAQADLWEQLKRGRLVALGVKVGETTWGPIPALAWSGLDYFYCDSGRSDSIGSNYPAVYHGVTVRRSAVLEIWPDIREDKARTKRGRKPRVRQEEFDEVVFELFEENGALLDDDPEWRTQGQVESAARAVLEKKLGKKIVPLK